MRRPDITDDHTALGGTGLNDLAVADVDACVMDLIPAVALGAGSVLPEDGFHDDHSHGVLLYSSNANSAV